MLTCAFVALALSAPAAEDIPAPSSPGWHVSPFDLAKGDFDLGLKGYVQEDLKSYPNWDANPVYRDPRSSLRRVRIGIEGGWRRLSFDIEGDPHDDAEHLKNAYVELKLSSALHVRAGNFKLPVSTERLMSEAHTDFVERSGPASRFGPDRDWGAVLSGRWHKRLSYEAGVFEGDGRQNAERADTTGAGRVVMSVRPGLDVAAGFAQGHVTADPEVDGVEAKPKGFDGKSPSGFRFYPRHFVNGRRRRLDADATWRRGPASLGAEFLQQREERRGQGTTCQGELGQGCDDLPELIGNGWVVQGTWLLTGEKKQRSIHPAHPFFHGPGAIELAVRYDALRFGEAGSSTGFQGAGSRTRNLRPGGNDVLTGGLSWWPEQWLRLLGNVAMEHYRDPVFAPVPGRTGHYLSLLARLQLEIP